jgi:hypothetical protein
MKTNEKRSIILIENPFTGNESVAKALRLGSVQGDPKWSLPADSRKNIPAEEWRAATKMVMVRDTRARFEAAATYAVLKGFDENNHPEFNELLVSMLDTSAEEKGRLVLSFLLQSTDKAPAYLQPQSRWLTCKYDVVLATPNIAEYFNKEVGKGCVRSNHMRSNRALKASHVTADEALLREVYAEDITLLNKLKVWSPSPTEIRLVSGPCKRCMENGKKLLELLEPSELGADEAEAEIVIDNMHVRANEEKAPKGRKRKRSLAVEHDVADIDMTGYEA